MSLRLRTWLALWDLAEAVEEFAGMVADYCRERACESAERPTDGVQPDDQEAW